LVKKRAFSLYDVEQFLREAGAERINEKAVISLEKELQDTVNELVQEASVYANYAGRKKLINISDIKLASNGKLSKRYVAYRHQKPKRKLKARGIEPQKIMLVNNVPVIKAEQVL